MASAARRPGSFDPAAVSARLAQLLPDPAAPLAVAFSGGSDSTALLAALAGQPALRPRLRALHVNHGLRPGAASWERHCRRLARRLGVPLAVRRVRVAPLRGASLEAQARAARYAALAALLKPGEVLLTAHQSDDQLETFLLQLLRGAGPAGLAAMPPLAVLEGHLLARPLLEVPGAALRAWLSARDLPWIEDDSNRLERHDRNYLRAQVLPPLLARWPAAARTVGRSARLQAEAQRLLEALGRADAARAACGAALEASALRALSPERRRNALRYWLTQAGQRSPDSRCLDELAGPLLAARADAHPEVRWREGRVVRERGLLWLRPPPGAVAGPLEQRWSWRRRRRAALPAPFGTLSLEEDAAGALDLDALAPVLTLRNRRGGERLRPRRGGPRRALKGLLQQAQVPLAQRACLPLLFAGAQLVAAGDRWLDASVQAHAASRRRGRLVWRPPA